MNFNTCMVRVATTIIRIQSKSITPKNPLLLPFVVTSTALSDFSRTCSRPPAVTSIEGQTGWNRGKDRRAVSCMCAAQRTLWPAVSIAPEWLSPVVSAAQNLSRDGPGLCPPHPRVAASALHAEMRQVTRTGPWWELEQEWTGPLTPCLVWTLLWNTQHKLHD